MGKVEDAKAKHRALCVDLGIDSVTDINRIIANGNIGGLIDICEARHARAFKSIANQIHEKGSRAVFIAGPSASGKTTTAYRLKSELNALGLNSISVSLDDYYKLPEDMPKNADGEPDFEALESIDYRRFNSDLADLAYGREAIMPRFDFKHGVRIPEARRLKLGENELLIVEGIHGLNPKLADNIGENVKFRLYCTALCGLSDKDGVRIPSHKLRMARRLVRDYYFRSSDYKVTLDLWTNQETSAERNIYPYSETADVIFNSSLIYEFNVYRPHLLKVLDGVSDDYEFAGEALYLRNLALSLKPFGEAQVPEESLVREFIGGSSIEY